MTTFLRRFVYLIVDGKRPGTLDLHRINMARFFNPRSPPIVSAAMVDARLPRPTMTIYAPSSKILTGRMNKVLATDQMGSAAVYDAGLHAMCAAPAFSEPKDSRSVSVSVGDRLYVLDASRSREENFFEALVCEGDGGGPPAGLNNRLPTPPYGPVHIGAYAVVGGSKIWVSTEQAPPPPGPNEETGRCRSVAVTETLLRQIL